MVGSQFCKQRRLSAARVQGVFRDFTLKESVPVGRMLLLSALVVERWWWWW